MSQESMPTRPPGALARELAHIPSAPGSELVLAASLEGFRPFDLLPFLAQSRATGVLLARTGPSERSFTFEAGRLVWATSSEIAERLGEVAVRFGMVQRPVLERELEQMRVRPDGRRLGKRLVDAEVLTGHELWRLLRLHLGEIFFGLLGATSGTVWFLRSESPPPVTHVSLDVQTLLMDGARRVDELAHFRRLIPASDSVPERTGRTAELPARASLVLGWVDGTRTVAELGALTRLGEFEATKVLHALAEGGLVVVHHQRPPGAAPAGADADAILATYNVCLSEVFGAAKRAGAEERFREAVDAYLRADPELSRWLPGGALELFGTLPNDILPAARGITAGALRTALDGLLDAALFHASEILGPEQAEVLAASVRAQAAEAGSSPKGT